MLLYYSTNARWMKDAKFEFEEEYNVVSLNSKYLFFFFQKRIFIPLFIFKKKE
jgi:hypothetical protein